MKVLLTLFVLFIPLYVHSQTVNYLNEDVFDNNDSSTLRVAGKVDGIRFISNSVIFGKRKQKCRTYSFTSGGEII
ncbi:hypothetical protein [Photobacterium leiognathi]|uniref:hypothetical protein n=1 Tax=Photobacterium leiognathi TaxID=553611 RepID=UPI00273960B7|nr:hypothetical protein [Photobacterium leiognathi]